MPLICRARIISTIYLFIYFTTSIWDKLKEALSVLMLCAPVKYFLLTHWNISVSHKSAEYEAEKQSDVRCPVGKTQQGRSQLKETWETYSPIVCKGTGPGE